MAHFIVIHTRAINEITQENVFTSFRDLARTESPGTTWLRSWMSVDATRLFCLWEAADEEHIRAALGPERLAMLPIQATYEVVDVDPSFFV